jgi:purine-binding chemotaxis protein CheW
MSGRPINPETGEIDWGEVRTRVAQAFDRSTGETSPARIREVLVERARRLALVTERPEAAIDALELLPFRLGREHYAIETRYAREVVRLTGFTSVPSTEDFLLGVANLRGEIVPVFDLMLFFGFASQGLSDRSRVIVVGAAEVEFGIIADSVQAVMRLPATALVADAAFEGERGGECIRGVTRDAMIVLDGAALLKDRRLFIGSTPDASVEAST